MKIVKAHCGKYDKWFRIAVDDAGQAVNFEGMSPDAARACQTGVRDTGFTVSPALRPCRQCGSRRVGRCGHVEKLGLCGAEYSFQCLYCDQLRISLEQASSRFSEYVGQSNIPGAELDKYGNPLGEKYDLAKRDSFKGFRVVILSLTYIFSAGGDPRQTLDQGTKYALEEKGFEVIVTAPPDERFDDRGRPNAAALAPLLREKTQLWIISDTDRRLDDAAISVIERFWRAGGSLYLWGDNDPFHADIDRIGQRLLGSTMQGTYEGDRVLGVRKPGAAGGIIPGHPISTGIAHFYEGITIAAVRTSDRVRPLVYSSDGNVVTAYAEESGGCGRVLMDGGFTRLYYKWDSAGTDRFVTNCAAWLAGDAGGGEVPFT
ncbi:MAG: hypothetical protein IJH78_05255 [Clostridia bacterium]|nr:hypothetical protein [Clostridia bacterium]